MLPNLPRLLQNVNVFLAELGVRIFEIMFVDELRQTQGAPHPCRATANDDNIRLHLRPLDTLNWLAEDEHSAPTSIQPKESA